MLNQLKIGFSAYSKALHFMQENNLRRYFLFPLLLNVLIWVIGFSISGAMVDSITESLLSLFGLSEDGENFGFLSSVFWWLVLILLKIMMFFILHFIGGGIVLMLLSPVLAYLSEKTDQILTGKDYPFDTKQFIKDIVRGVLIAMRNTVLQGGFMIFFLLLGFVPIIGWLLPFVLFGVSAYFYGFSFMDYTCERKKMSIKESIRFIRLNKGIAISNGAIYSLTLMIPYIGTMISGFSAIVSVIAATISVQELEKVQKT